MASHIHTIAVSRNSFFTKKGFLFHAVRSSKKCLKENHGNNDLDLLVCCAIYRDDHIVEPALSSLILGELTRKPLLLQNSNIRSSSQTFSFDINNGPCGLLQGIAFINQQIQSGEIINGLIVAGDSANRAGLKENYSFAPGAAALLLSKGEEGKGFLVFQHDSYLDDEKEFLGISQFKNNSRTLKIEQPNNYVGNLAKCAFLSFNKFLQKENLKNNDIDLVISSQYPEGFSSLIQDQLDLGDRLIQLKDEDGFFHSAAPLFALHAVYRSSVFQSAKKILFLTAGSGINISIALYQQ